MLAKDGINFSDFIGAKYSRNSQFSAWQSLSESDFV